ncbi:hypothetical protein C5167_019669 [Papaver somniferum]|uniref:Uncharacterized protein n=1 Tax=Papaver somniferum TaxID=3469 RepID=A0A4Y7IUX1_PAPSO|nr:hypothetical protein C5167_019669 [Papaver somniferum]
MKDKSFFKNDSTLIICQQQHETHIQQKMSMKHQQVLMDSQGKILGFYPRRSPRIIDRQSQQQGYAHLQRRRATYARQSQQQRDCHLQQGRAAYEVKQDSIAEVETLALLDQTDFDDKGTFLTPLMLPVEDDNKDLQAVNVKK